MPKELRENIPLVVSSWSCWFPVFICQSWVLLWHWTFFYQSLSGWHPLKRFETSSQLHKLVSLFHVCSVWNHSLNWKRLRQKPVEDAADSPAFIQCDSSDWTSMTTSFPSPHPSSLFPSTLLLILRMGWWSIWGRLESVQDWEKMVICFTGQLIPHLTEWDWRNIEKERRRWDETWCH